MPDQRRIIMNACCRNCEARRPANQSRQDWSRLDVGLTDTGMQVWCRRCRMQVAHFTPQDIQEWIDDPPGCDCCPGGRHHKPGVN